MWAPFFFTSDLHAFTLASRHSVDGQFGFSSLGGVLDRHFYARTKSYTFFGFYHEWKDVPLFTFCRQCVHITNIKLCNMCMGGDRALCECVLCARNWKNEWKKERERERERTTHFQYMSFPRLLDDAHRSSPVLSAYEKEDWHKNNVSIYMFVCVHSYICLHHSTFTPFRIDSLHSHSSSTLICAKLGLYENFQLNFVNLFLCPFPHPPSHHVNHYFTRNGVSSSYQCSFLIFYQHHNHFSFCWTLLSRCLLLSNAEYFTSFPIYYTSACTHNIVKAYFHRAHSNIRVSKHILLSGTFSRRSYVSNGDAKVV